MAKRTTLPWKLETLRQGHVDEKLVILGANREIICYMRHPHNKNDAAFIVEAVNRHQRKPQPQRKQK